MAVAKRQRKGKAYRNEAKENMWAGVRTSGETCTPPSWLAQFATGRLKGGRRQRNRRRKPRQTEASPLGSARPHASRCLFNKTEL